MLPHSVIYYCLDSLIKSETDESIELFIKLFMQSGDKLESLEHTYKDKTKHESKTKMYWEKLEFLKTDNKLTRRVKF